MLFTFEGFGQNLPNETMGAGDKAVPASSHCSVKSRETQLNPIPMTWVAHFQQEDRRAVTAILV